VRCGVNEYRRVQDERIGNGSETRERDETANFRGVAFLIAALRASDSVGEKPSANGNADGRGTSDRDGF